VATIGAAQLVASAQGMNAPLNLRLNATVAGNALTVAIKTAANADASASSPVLIPFRDPTLANGDPIIASLQAALSFTVASPNTLGTSSGSIAFRLWVIAYYNGGTVALGLFNASTATQIFGLPEGALATTAASTNGGSSAGTHYANVSAITNTPFRIIGYLEWASGLATAGTWASAPTTIQLFGPGIKKPGDVVQTLATTTTTQATGTPNLTKVDISGWGITPAITPTSAVNPIRVRLTGSLTTANGGSGYVATFRGTNATLIGNYSVNVTAGGVAGGGVVSNEVWDNPHTTSSTTYGGTIVSTVSNNMVWLGTSGSIPASSGSIILDEIMG
jgi:hypothetical protein